MFALLFCCSVLLRVQFCDKCTRGDLFSFPLLFKGVVSHQILLLMSANLYENTVHTDQKIVLEKIETLNFHSKNGQNKT